MDPKRTSWLFGALLAAVVALVVGFERDPSSAQVMLGPREQVHDVFLAGTIAGALGVAAFAVARARGWLARRAVRRALHVGLVLACAAMGVTYFYGVRGWAHRHYNHVHDFFHYFVGPKYYAELDYDDLYRCAVAAAEGSDVFRADLKIRDLTTLQRAKLRDRAAGWHDDCRRRFSDERWRELRHDVLALGGVSKQAMRSAIGDHGYNGAPFFSLVGALAANALSRVAPLDYPVLATLPLIDVAIVCAMLLAVTRAFGASLGLVAALFYFTAFVDRFSFTGGSFLRFLWLGTLVMGIVELKRARHGRAGAWLALSASLNVFPVLFALAVPLKALWSVARRRPVPAAWKRFMAAGLATGALCFVLGAAHARHLGNYGSFLADMRQHDVAARAPGFGVGLKFDFIAARKLLDSELRSLTKAEILQPIRPLVYGCAALLLGVLGWLLPKLDDVEATILLGFALVFCLFGPTAYYYAFSFLLVLAFHQRTGRRGALALIGALFATNAVSYVLLRATNDLYGVLNDWVSLSWTAYLLAVLAYLWQVTRGSGPAPAASAPAAAEAS